MPENETSKPESEPKEERQANPPATSSTKASSNSKIRIDQFMNELPKGINIPESMKAAVKTHLQRVAKKQNTAKVYEDKLKEYLKQPAGDRSKANLEKMAKAKVRANKPKPQK